MRTRELAAQPRQLDGPRCSGPERNARSTEVDFTHAEQADTLGALVVDESDGLA